MGKRIFLFLVTNILVMVAITIVMSIIGIFFPGFGRISHGGQLQLGALFAMCLVWGMVGSFVSLLISRWMAKRSMGVELVDGNTGNADLDWLHATVARLSREAGLPMPEVGYYESPEVNAFATGPSKSRSLVAVSTGLLRTMNRAETEGVLAHEVSHIGNGDMVTMTLIQGVVNAFVMFFARIVGWAVGQALSNRDSDDDRPGIGVYLAQMGVTIAAEIVFGILASTITAWFSRTREYRADAGAARLAGRDKMIAALRKLQSYHETIDPRGAELATMKISGKAGWMALFSTHPDLDKRIAALEAGR
ncbi:MAG: protease HtpX [Fibrobacterota bacterium]